MKAIHAEMYEEGKHGLSRRAEARFWHALLRLSDASLQLEPLPGATSACDSTDTPCRWLQTAHMNSSRDPGAFCPLHGLRPWLYLACFMAADQPLLGRHFVRHYRDVVGVHLAHMRVWIHQHTSARPGDAERTQRALQREGLSAQAALVERTSLYTDRLMLSRVNRHMRTLPSAAWLIYANVDEFFTFPCDVPRLLLMRKDLLCMCMQDRLAASGRIVPIAMQPSLEEQFPLPCCEDAEGTKHGDLFLPF